MKHLIIDTSYLIYRSYFAYPKLTSKEGLPSGAVFGFCKTMLMLIDEVKPDTISFALDLPKPTWRHGVFAEYKAGRKPPDQAMIEQIPEILHWCRAITPNVFESEGFEADDHIHTLVQKINQHERFKLERNKPLEEGLFEENKLETTLDLDIHKISEKSDSFEDEIYIFSSDRDLYQLFVYNNVSILQIEKNSKGVGVFNKAKFVEKYGLQPIQWIDYKSLVGDGSDNLSGVEGLGEKTATKLLQEVGSLHALLGITGLDNNEFIQGSWVMGEHLEEIKKRFDTKKWAKFIEKIKTSEQNLHLTHTLSRLSFVPGEPEIQKRFDIHKGNTILEKFGMRNLLTTIQSKFQTTDNLQESIF